VTHCNWSASQRIKRWHELGGMDNMMLGSLLWRYVSSSEMGQASALAVIMAYRVPYPLLRSESGILLETRRISMKPI
jgi:ABC-type spermidine/putrescine transport system permease subunit I